MLKIAWDLRLDGPALELSYLMEEKVRTSQIIVFSVINAMLQCSKKCLMMSRFHLRISVKTATELMGMDALINV